MRRPESTRRDFLKIAGATALGVSAATLALMTIVSTVPALAQVINQQVRIDSGVIEGIVSGDVVSFKGIPYAAPPAGDLRWRHCNGCRKTLAPLAAIRTK